MVSSWLSCKVGHHLAGEALHHTLRVGVAVSSEVEIQDHLCDAGGLDVLQGRHTLLQIASDDTALAEIPWLHGPQAFDNIDEVSDVWRCCAPVIRESRKNALQVVQQALFGTERLGGRIGEAEKVRAHHLAVRVPRLTGERPELRRSLLEAAKHHGGSKGGKDGVKPTPCRHLDGWPTKARHVDGRVRLLYWTGQDGQRLQHLVELSRKGKLFLRPGGTDKLHLLIKAGPTLVKGDGKGIVLALVIAAPRRENRPTVAEQVEHGVLFRHT